LEKHILISTLISHAIFSSCIQEKLGKSKVKEPCLARRWCSAMKRWPVKRCHSHTSAPPCITTQHYWIPSH